MRAHRDHDTTSTRIPSARVASVAGAQAADPVLDGATPAEIRAMTFAAALGPDRAPFSADAADGNGVIDLAGEEALLAYLATLIPSNA